MNVNHKLGKSLPSIGQCINLSITQASFKKHGLFIPDAADIGSYMNSVNTRFTLESDRNPPLEDDLRFTPWGQWHKTHVGQWELHSSLNNRFMDIELAAPFATNRTNQENYKKAERGNGMTAKRSNFLRRVGKANARLVFKEMLKAAQVDIARGINVRLARNANDYDVLKYANDSVERELVYALNEFNDHVNHLMPDLKRLSKIYSHGSSSHRTAHIQNILPISNPIRTEKADQWIFIDHLTIASLFTKLSKKNRLFWHMLCNFAGIPSQCVSLAGISSPDRPLSPAALIKDPIHTVLQGMWMNGAADDFSIIANDDGLYFNFTLGGEGYNKVKSEEASFLNHPCDVKIPEVVKTTSVIDAFEEALQS
jgi:hypothetical protein